MENINDNPAEDFTESAVIEDSPVVEETPVVEDVVVEEPVKSPVVEEVKAEEPVVINAPVYDAGPQEQALGAVANGVIGATTTPKAPKKKPQAKPEKDAKIVAIISTKNVSWIGVGKVSKGINIVSQKEADEWMTRDHITLVSAEEVAKEFGK